MSEILSHEWRLDHAAKGDEMLRVAREVVDHTSGARGDQVIVLSAQASALAAIAQAHYAAANVRARAGGGERPPTPEERAHLKMGPR